MQDKIDGINEIYNRIKAARAEIGLASFKWAHESVSIKGAALPCVFVGDGADNIIKYNSRDYAGYPCSRIAQVFIEVVCEADGTVNSVFEKLRKAVLSNCIVSSTGFIRELKSSGIQNYNMPNIEAITLVLGLRYIDPGI